jgi:GNAT superfamily N-acetyltransferase
MAVHSGYGQPAPRITIQRVQAVADFELLHELLAEYECDLPEVLRHGAVPRVVELAREQGEREASFLSVAGETAIGCVAVRQGDGATAILMRLYVKPQSRGFGAARALVRAAIEFAAKSGYERIALDTDKEQLQPAYALYLSMGFHDCTPFAKVSYPCATFMERLL